MNSLDFQAYKPKGAIVINTVNKIADEVSSLIKQHNVLIDFSETTEIDSSALAMILQWRRDAEAANTQLSFSQVPVNLTTLADLYGVAFLFK
ncbi:MAG: STAS domain-containing protein [Betaproteobacteria bacterium]|nr:STAS domain-containing protein [Betaproteobacteria bacterium]MDE2423356.1 STAS domain-containing protein [Betaproteobacteria bacterium]